MQQLKMKEVPHDIPEVQIRSREPMWIFKLISDAGLVTSSGERGV